VGASGCTSGCTIPKEIDIVLLGDYINIPLNPPLINIKLEFNPFLIYRASKTNSTCSCGRKHDGLVRYRNCLFI
jgi:hypothetical protein